MHPQQDFRYFGKQRTLWYMAVHAFSRPNEFAIWIRLLSPWGVGY